MKLKKDSKECANNGRRLVVKWNSSNKYSDVEEGEEKCKTNMFTGKLLEDENC